MIFLNSTARSHNKDQEQFSAQNLHLLMSRDCVLKVRNYDLSFDSITLAVYIFICPKFISSWPLKFAVSLDTNIEEKSVQIYFSNIQHIFWQGDSYYWTNVTTYFFPAAGIYLLKFNDRNTRTRCEMCSELTIKTL